jgi:hypothetical protein
MKAAVWAAPGMAAVWVVPGTALVTVVGSPLVGMVVATPEVVKEGWWHLEATADGSVLALALVPGHWPWAVSVQ